MTFELSGPQIEKFNNWKTSILKNKPHINMPNQTFSFRFTQTGIGLHVEVIFNATQEKIDLSEYDNW